MPLIDITNPDVIKFLVESYDKTARLRMKWNNIHGDKLKHAATLQREERGYYETDVLKTAMAAGMPTITRDYKSGTPNRRAIINRDGVPPTLKNLKKGHSIVDVGLGDPENDPRLAELDSESKIAPVMRPIDPEQKNIIYKGIPYFGREAYLTVRNKISPEDKYYFNECTDWDYGWRLEDSCFSKTAPKYGRVCRMNRDRNSRTGPQPDPSHYKMPDVGTVEICPI